MVVERDWRWLPGWVMERKSVRGRESVKGIGLKGRKQMYNFTEISSVKNLKKSVIIYTGRGVARQ